MKALLRDLAPPIVLKALRRLRGRAPGGEADLIGQERSHDWYDAGYEAVHSYRQHYAASPYYPLWCVMVDRIRPTQVRQLLDIGCGPGQFGAFLRDKGLQKYVGLDFSEVCVRMARSACPTFEFVCADALATDLFSTLDYDVLVATEFLEHINEDLRILERIRPGARFYGSVPNFPHAGHVRHFQSADEVTARYQDYFTDFRVDEFLYGTDGMSLFLFEGVKRER